MEKGIWNNLKIDRGTLKLIAMAAMVLDHIGFGLILMGYVPYVEANYSRELAELAFMQIRPIYLILRGIGRIAFPIYCFQLAEGFDYTKNIRRYVANMIAFAFISEIPFNLMCGEKWYGLDYQNVYFTLLIGLLVLAGLKKLQNRVVPQAAVFLAGAAAAYFMRTDYGIWGIIIISMFYLLKGDKTRMAMVGVPTLIVESRYAFGLSALSFIPIWLYSGEKGKLRGKYIFYWFYPVHIAVIVLIRFWLFGM